MLKRLYWSLVHQNQFEALYNGSNIPSLSKHLDFPTEKPMQEPSYHSIWIIKNPFPFIHNSFGISLWRFLRRHIIWMHYRRHYRFTRNRNYTLQKLNLVLITAKLSQQNLDLETSRYSKQYPYANTGLAGFKIETASHSIESSALDSHPSKSYNWHRLITISGYAANVLPMVSGS